MRGLGLSLFAGVSLLLLAACGGEKADESGQKPVVAEEKAEEMPPPEVAPASQELAAAGKAPEQSNEAALAAEATSEAVAAKSDATAPDGNKGGGWPSWRGPLQNGMSLETYGEWAFVEEPAWTFDRSVRGAPVVFDGKVFVFNYDVLSNEDVREYLTALDEETGEVLWEHEFIDFISDTVYDRYSVGSPVVDVNSGDVYLMLANGLFTCFSADGDVRWQHSMMERYGRLTFSEWPGRCSGIGGGFRHRAGSEFILGGARSGAGPFFCI